MNEYVIAVPRDKEPIDFAGSLSGIDNLTVKASGPRRRVRVSATEPAIETARKNLPSGTLIEKVVAHQTMR